MPSVKYAPNAIRDLQRLRAFLSSKNPVAAQRAAETIRKAVAILAHQPQIGRLIADMSLEYRQWAIDFGDSGYIVRYRFERDTIIILAIRHQKEAGF